MVQLIRSLFSQVLKTNSNLRFAVITGCLRISKESIFTGLNNLKVLSIADVQFAEYFGAERQVTVSREISKLHEETVRGSLAELIEHFTATEPRGEIVIVLAGIDD